MRDKILKLVFPVLFMITCLIFLGFYVHKKVINHLENLRLVDHTYEVLLKVTSIRKNINEVDVEYLFYLVNDNKLHIRNHEQAISFAKSRLTNLQLMVEDNPSQISNLEELKICFDKRIEFIRGVIDKKQENFPIPEVGENTCILLRTDIQNTLDKIMAEEKRLLIKREQENQNSLLQLVVTLSIIVMLLCASFSFIFGIIYADLRKSDSMNNFLDRIKR